MLYLGHGKDTPSEREVLPWKLYSRWGKWYVMGPDLNGTEVKQFRVDRMQTAEVGTVDFDPPPELDPPEFFDMTKLERSVTVVAPRSVIDGLPQPNRVEDQIDEPDSRVRATVTVVGERQVDRLLLSLGPHGDVVDASELADRRRGVGRNPPRAHCLTALLRAELDLDADTAVITGPTRP